jgi:hypothetical protein
MMGVDAVNVTMKELADSLDKIEAVRTAAAVPMISANIVYEESEEPVFTPSLTLKKGPYTVGVVGVCELTGRNWRAADGRNVVIADPAASAKPLVAALRKEADLVIVLAHLQYRNISELARALPEADLILGGDGYTITYELTSSESIPVCYSGRQGKNIGIVRIWKEKNKPPRSELEMVNLRATLPENPDVKALVDEAKKDLDEEMQGAEADRLQEVNPDYASYTACRTCHREAYKKWMTTGHFQAFNPLIDQQKATEAECLKCHTTGFGDGGFVSLTTTPRMVHVQCEACHGPGARHAADPKTHRPARTRTAAPCLRCHDRANSPNFDYDAYWGKIAH